MYMSKTESFQVRNSELIAVCKGHMGTYKWYCLGEEEGITLGYLLSRPYTEEAPSKLVQRHRQSWFYWILAFAPSIYAMNLKMVK